MKQPLKIALKLFVVLTLITTAVFSQSMRKSIQQLESAKTVDEYLAAEQNFNKFIADKKKLHEAYYYGALTNLYLAFTDTLRTDDYCARADKFLHQLDSMAPNNSEAYVLMAMSSGAKITVDRAGRQIKFGPLANKQSDRATSINPENPRAWLIKAKTVMNTPAKLGGGPKFALKYYQKSVDKYRTFKPLTDTEPNWGAEMAKKEFEDCKKMLSK
ncbi:MAG: hypothetical protein KA163_11095 [Bacteroidia bacterium]|nr:hypothetical protein [Bacteroidia bacterium]